MDSVEIIQKVYIDQFEPQERQVGDYKNLCEAIQQHGISIINAPQYENCAFAYLDGAGVPLILYGNQREWRGKDRIWVQVSKHVQPRKWPKLWKILGRWLEELQQTSWRIEADVEADFVQGIRALEILGFKREGFMLKYNPEGRDCYMYALVK